MGCSYKLQLFAYHSLLLRQFAVKTVSRYIQMSIAAKSPGILFHLNGDTREPLYSLAPSLPQFQSTHRTKWQKSGLSLGHLSALLPPGCRKPLDLPLALAIRQSTRNLTRMMRTNELPSSLRPSSVWLSREGKASRRRPWSPVRASRPSGAGMITSRVGVGWK